MAGAWGSLGLSLASIHPSVRGREILRSWPRRRSDKFVSRVLNEAKRPPLEKTGARASLSSLRARPGVWAHRARQSGGRALPSWSRRQESGILLTTLPLLRFHGSMVLCLKTHSILAHIVCWPYADSIRTETKVRLGRGSELRPFYMGTLWGRGSQWCNRLR